MHKLKKLAAFMLLAVMLLSLTACMGMQADIKVNPDGSGTITTKMGLSEEAYKQAQETGQSTGQITGDQLLYINGRRFYGEEETKKFADLEELQTILNDGSDFIQVYKDEKGQFCLKLHVEKTDWQADGLLNEDGSPMSASDAYKAGVEMWYLISMPGVCVLKSGRDIGFSAGGDPLNINFVSMFATMERENIDSFDAELVWLKTYDDVSTEAWYFDAIMDMTGRGILTGIGDNKFAPNDKITWGQLCTIIARAQQKTYVATPGGHWATPFIDYCVEQGYCPRPGSPDAQVSREAAVATIYRALCTGTTPYKKLTAADIPDYSSISGAYASDVLKAFNVGLTSGTDSNHTFAPKSILTRAQVCQLVYNALT